MATVAEGGKVPPVELECPVVGCTLGENGGRYKTPPVPGTGITEALQLLTMHNQNHAQAQGVDVVTSGPSLHNISCLKRVDHI